MFSSVSLFCSGTGPRLPRWAQSQTGHRNAGRRANPPPTTPRDSSLNNDAGGFTIRKQRSISLDRQVVNANCVRLPTVHWIIIWPDLFSLCARDKICCVPNYFLSHPTHPVKIISPPHPLLPSSISPFPTRANSSASNHSHRIPLPLRLLKTAKGDSRHHVCLRRLQGPFVIAGLVISSSSLTL